MVAEAVSSGKKATMFRIFALALSLQVLAVLAVPTKPTPTKPTPAAKPNVNNTTAPTICNSVVLGQCNKGNKHNAAYEEVHAISYKNCKSQCDLVFTDKCQFFIFDYRQNVCQIWNLKLDDYKNTCTKEGGPKKDVNTKCSADCQKLQNDFCLFDGDVLDQFPNIKDKGICQKACEYTDRCQYYVYDTETKDCELRNSNLRACDQILASTKSKSSPADCKPRIVNSETQT